MPHRYNNVLELQMPVQIMSRLSVNKSITVLLPHSRHHIIVYILHGKGDRIVERELARCHTRVARIATESFFSSVYLARCELING